MATQGAYKRIDDGLVLHFDAANIKCFRGEPTVNYVVLASTMGNCRSYINGNDGTFLTEFGTIGYRMTHRTSWNGLYTDISIPIAGTYTISAYFRYLGGTANNNGATVYTSGGGIPDSAVGLNKSLVGVWQRVSMTNTYTGSFTFYMISYGGNTSDWSSWEVTMPQVEQKDHVTPFVNGTRGTTVSTGGGLIDLSNNGNNGEIVNNILYDSNKCGSLIFDGVNDYIKTTNTLDLSNTNVISVSFWLKTNINSGIGALIESSYNFNGTNAFAIFINDPIGSGKLIFGTWNNGYNIVITDKAVNDNLWHNVIFINTRGSGQNQTICYIDGVLSSTTFYYDTYHNENIMGNLC